MAVPPSGGASERGAVELTDVTKRFGTMVAVDRLNLSVEPGEFLSLLGPSRMRQDHDPAHAGRLRAARRGFHPHQRRVRAGNSAVQARRQHRLPGIRAVPAHDRRRERRLRPAPEARPQVGDRQPGQRGPRHGEDDQAGRAPAAADVGWSAAARCRRSSPGQPPERAAARRAARRARPQAARRDADRAEAAAEPARHHVRLRDPRPGRGDEHEQPHRHHARRSHRAARRSGDRVRAARLRIRRRIHRSQQLLARRRDRRRHESPTTAPCSSASARRAGRAGERALVGGATRELHPVADRSRVDATTCSPARLPASRTSATPCSTWCARTLAT